MSIESGWQAYEGRPLERGDRCVVVSPFDGRALELVTVKRLADAVVYVHQSEKPYNPAVLVHQDPFSAWPEVAWRSVKRRTSSNDRRPVAL